MSSHSMLLNKVLPWKKSKLKKEKASTVVLHHVKTGTTSTSSKLCPRVSETATKSTTVKNLAVPPVPIHLPPSSISTASTSAGASKVALPHSSSPSLTAKAYVEQLSDPRQLSPSSITNTPDEESDRQSSSSPPTSTLIPDCTSPPCQSKKVNPAKTVTKYMKVTLRALGELTGAPAVGSFIESVDLDEGIDLKRKDLEDYCSRFLESMKSIKSLTHKEGLNVPESLKVNLDGLLSELTAKYHKILGGKEGAFDVESMGHDIARLLESFLFENHVIGFITMPSILDKVNAHALNQAIRDLPRAGAAYNDYASSDKRRAQCFEGTRQALLAGIAKWIRAGGETQAYLLSGLAGIGKSTVAQTVAARADEAGYLGASFFFSRDEAARRDAQRFFTTIAFQLCVYDEEFAQAIGSVLLTERGATATSKEPLEQLNALIVEPLRHLLNHYSRPLVIVVDALDECDEEDGLIILEALEHLVHQLPSLRVVLTSRPKPRLEEFFDNHRVFHMHNIEDEVVDNDIRLYLTHRLSWGQIRSHLNLKSQWSAADDDIESLVRAAGRLFIIASTAVLFILDKAARDPASQMKKLQTAFAQNRMPFNALNNFYTIILRSAVPVSCDHDVAERYQYVVGTIAYVQDPLPIQALANLIGLNPEAVRAVLDNLQCVILLGGDDVPHIYHKSFLDYITDSNRCKADDLRIVPRDLHTRITLRCFNVMNTRLKRNILGLGTPAQFMANSAGLEAEGILDGRVREKISADLQYACVYWANHLEAADTEDNNLMKEVGAFANDHLLHWFEVLSWVRKLDMAHRTLLVLPKLLKPRYSDTRELFSDALRFISKFYDVIQQSALHTYHSALPFTPTKIPLYEICKNDMRNRCQLESGPEQWDAVVAIPKHESSHIVHHITFSPNGFHLASWARQEMKLWDATSGTPVKTFKGDGITLAEDFSTVALSQDSVLTLYNVASNALIATFKPSTEVVRLALSLDGARLAAGLSDERVSLWDRGTRESIASLGGYASKNGLLVFSPSGHNLAFLSDDGGIRLWNGSNGEPTINLRYGSERHVEFMFSRDGSRLAALTWASHLPSLTPWNDENGHSLTLWDGESGSFLGYAKGVEHRLAISGDGSLIATGGRNGSVQLWGGNSLSLIDSIGIDKWIESLAFSNDMLVIGTEFSVTLYNHKTGAIISSPQFSRPWCLALSPDCTRLAAAKHGGTVHLWDVPSLKASISASTEQHRIVTALAFSLDCLRLASGFKGGTVELWDTSRTEQIIATFKHHELEVTALAFSPDGERLASGSADETIRLWDGRENAPSGILRFSSARLWGGKPRGIFQHRFPGTITSIAFSNLLLAAATYSDITLWDRKTLHLVCTLDVGGHHLSFSSDGSRLASAYNWRQSFASVTVWDAEVHIQIAQFDVNSAIERLILSQNGSRLAAATFRHDDGRFKFFDVVSWDTITNPGLEDISQVFPHRILISQSYDHDYGHCVRGWFSGYHDGIPILQIPRDIEGGGTFIAGSFMFALAGNDGRILIGRIPPASTT